MSIPEMAPLNPEPFGTGYGHERPYRQLHPPEPTRRRRIITTKDEVQVLADGTEIRLPVEDRPPQKITRVTSFGTEVIDLSSAREDQDR